MNKIIQLILNLDIDELIDLSIFNLNTIILKNDIFKMLLLTKKLVYFFNLQ